MLIKWMCVHSIFIIHICRITLGTQQNILVFGGNGFMGAETVERILSQNDNYKVTLINRGNWYWDSDTRIKPFVHNIICDRTQLLSVCVSLQSILSDGVYFDFVVDFSAYHPFQITNVLEIFQGMIGRYIYVSSDSVYEVCEKSHDGYALETDAVRPVDETVRRELNAKDEYGNEKLGGEEVLINEDVPYLILRLPDVIGPRDNTLRWWTYQLWLKLSTHLTRQITIPIRLFSKPISFVYVNDVADLIERSLTFKDEVFNQAYNLAFSETWTLYQVLSKIGRSLEKEDINILLDERRDYFYLFPSVTMGPINIEKAKKYLDWKPTPFEIAAEETIRFYEDAMTNKTFTKNANQVIENIKRYFTEDPNEVDRGLATEYGIGSYQNREDL